VGGSEDIPRRVRSPVSLALHVTGGTRVQPENPLRMDGGLRMSGSNYEREVN